MVESKRTGSVRERLLQAADELFYEEGVHIVGIDRVLARAGVAKASLYGTFGSKDELVRAYLEGRGLRIQERIAKRIAGHEGPRDRILSVFDQLSERVADGSFRGCAFINACAEGAPGATPAREVAAAHRAWRCDLFAKLARELGVPDPVETGRELSLLYDGALVASSMDSDSGAPATARKLAESLLDTRVATKAVARSSAKRRRSRRPRAT
jgi:AcrR family transcriptional regulator